MLNPINRSKTLATFLERLSAWLARRRGLLPLFGVLLLTISFVVHLIGLAAPSPALSLIWSITHHLGLIIALIGLLLIEPLGG